MKLILSRKGFDSAAGGCPSPIFPDGKLLSLPIPSSHDARTHRDAQWDGSSLDDLVRQLSGRAPSSSKRMHLDPDVYAALIPRPKGWRPALGQVGGPETHLQRHGVGPGDLFLFFGWFRRVEQTRDGWRYIAGAPHLHVLFGWLEIAERWDVVEQRRQALARHPWLAEHAHFSSPTLSCTPNNAIYVAANRLGFSSGRAPCVGGGAFTRASADLTLTAPGSSRSHWQLPGWFRPRDGRPPLSHHGNPERWSAAASGRVHLASVGRGQEFVLDADAYPEAIPWAHQLIEAHA